MNKQLSKKSQTRKGPDTENRGHHSIKAQMADDIGCASSIYSNVSRGLRVGLPTIPPGPQLSATQIQSIQVDQQASGIENDIIPVPPQKPKGKLMKNKEPQIQSKNLRSSS